MPLLISILGIQRVLQSFIMEFLKWLLEYWKWSQWFRTTVPEFGFQIDSIFLWWPNAEVCSKAVLKWLLFRFKTACYMVVCLGWGCFQGTATVWHDLQARLSRKGQVWSCGFVLRIYLKEIDFIDNNELLYTWLFLLFKYDMIVLQTIHN